MTSVKDTQSGFTYFLLQYFIYLMDVFCRDMKIDRVPKLITHCLSSIVIKNKRFKGSTFFFLSVHRNTGFLGKATQEGHLGIR